MPLNPLIPLSGNRSRLPDIISLGKQRQDKLAQNEITNRQNQATLDLATRQQVPKKNRRLSRITKTD